MNGCVEGFVLLVDFCRGCLPGLIRFYFFFLPPHKYVGAKLKPFMPCIATRIYKSGRDENYFSHIHHSQYLSHTKNRSISRTQNNRRHTHTHTNQKRWRNIMWEVKKKTEAWFHWCAFIYTQIVYTCKHLPNGLKIY